MSFRVTPETSRSRFLLKLTRSAITICFIPAWLWVVLANKPKIFAPIFSLKRIMSEVGMTRCVDSFCFFSILLKQSKHTKHTRPIRKKNSFWKYGIRLKTLKKGWCYLLSTTFILKYLNEIGDRAKRNYVGLQQEWWPRVQRGNFLTEEWNSAESLSAAEPPCKVSNGPRIYNYWKHHQVEDRFTKQNTGIYWNGRKTTFRICTHLGLS